MRFLSSAGSSKRRHLVVLSVAMVPVEETMAVMVVAVTMEDMVFFDDVGVDVLDDVLLQG